MRKTELKRFEKRLLEERDEILRRRNLTGEEFSVNSDERPDEVDQATYDSLQSNGFRQRNREQLLLKKIDKALNRIMDGSFGLCLECEEKISKPRLLARPIAELCISCKETQENLEKCNAQGLKRKSLGEAFSRQIG